MAERSLRGRSIGAKSLESEIGVRPAERNPIAYVCPKGHRTVVPFANQATVPATWFCHCGLTCVREDRQGDPVEGGKAKRSHYDMLLERRTEEQLKALLKKKIEEHELGELADYD